MTKIDFDRLLQLMTHVYAELMLNTARIKGLEQVLFNVLESKHPEIAEEQKLIFNKIFKQVLDERIKNNLFADYAAEDSFKNLLNDIDGIQKN